ncbi:MAG: UPF0262 family protein [Propylenella sp.]
MSDRQSRLVAVTLDDASIGRASPDIEHERTVAIYDLIEENRFVLSDHPGPYRLVLSLADRRLVFDIRDGGGKQLITHALSLTPFARIVKDYHLICDSYHQAIRVASPSRIEAIDMGRRALHNEGSEILRQRLNGKVELDLDTARRLFTLICVLHWRG